MVTNMLRGFPQALGVSHSDNLTLIVNFIYVVWHFHGMFLLLFFFSFIKLISLNGWLQVELCKLCIQLLNEACIVLDINEVMGLI